MSRFTMPEVNNCCGCISLRAGTITYGVLACIGSLTRLMVYNMGEVPANENVEPDDQTPEDETASVSAVSVITSVIVVIVAFLSIFMTWAAVKRKTGALKAWILILWIIIVWDCFSLMLIPFQSGTNGEKSRGATHSIVDGVFTAYQLLVIHSYRQQIISESVSDTSC